MEDVGAGDAVGVDVFLEAEPFFLCLTTQFNFGVFLDFFDLEVDIVVVVVVGSSWRPFEKMSKFLRGLRTKCSRPDVPKR